MHLSRFVPTTGGTQAGCLHGIIKKQQQQRKSRISNCCDCRAPSVGEHVNKTAVCWQVCWSEGLFESICIISNSPVLYKLDICTL